MEHAEPKIKIEYVQDTTIATLIDEKILEEMDIMSLGKTLIPLVEATDGLSLIIDFSNVKFLSSAVLGLLIRISKKIYESGGQLKLCCIDPKILKVFKITRLNKVFDIYKDREKALKDL